MSPAIQFSVYGTPRPKGSAKAFLPKGWTRPIITSDNKGLKAWEDTIRAALQDVMANTSGDVLTAIYDAPIAVTLRFHLPRPQSLSKKVALPTKKPDLDKLARGAIDALNGILFKDDSQVVAIGARKTYATTAPHVDILVEAWTAAVDPIDRTSPQALLDLTPALKESHG
jgi:crossover junction endodeoxyribonuclease RusA